MSHAATLRLDFGSAEKAARMLASLAPDDDGHLALRLDGSILVLATESASPLGLLRTLDEALAQLSAAEKAERVARA